MSPAGGVGSPHYLLHLDGLRAVAVTVVLLYHFELARCIGGYTGVDAFFVISGFIVSRNLLRQADEGRLLLRDFYVRRFWRLAPASVVAVGASLVAAVAFFPPTYAAGVAASAAASLVAASNVYFATQVGYFDDSKYRGCV